MVSSIAPKLGSWAIRLPKTVITIFALLCASAYASSFTFEATAPATSVSGLVSQANGYGARGFRYFGDLALGSGPVISSYYVKDSGAAIKYTYESGSIATSADAFLSQANECGARGFRYFGPLAIISSVSAYELFNLYEQDSSGTSHTYEALTPSTTSDSFLAQAGAEGEKGFEYVGDMIFGQDMRAVYVKHAGLARTYSYHLLASASSKDAALLQMNKEGRAGFQYQSDVIFSGSAGTFALFVKDSSAAAPCGYKALPSQTSMDTFLSQVNTEGGNGYQFLGASIFLPALDIFNLFVGPPTSSGGLAIQTAPAGQSITAGGAINLSVSASGDGLQYQWKKDGTAIIGASTATLSIASATSLDAGNYTVTVSSGSDAVTSGAAQVVIAPTLQRNVAARLVNISSRTPVSGTSDGVQIAGFVISGSVPKQVLIRASGPALTGFGVAGAITDPVVTLYDGSNHVVASNDDWDFAAVDSVARGLGAFGWTRGSKDAAIVVTLPPGLYSAVIKDSKGGAGVALAEVYEVDGGESRPVNISTRSFIGTGDNVQVAGFVIGGTGPKTVLIRASGPALTSFGLPGAVADPVLTVYNSGGVEVVSNDNWVYEDIETVARSLGAFDWQRGSKDAAVLVTLPPGLYSAVVKGANSTTGVGLIEVYDVNR